jgi:hypothetical protein
VNRPSGFALFEALWKYKVDFIVVGGVCAVLQGAPVTTFDLDLVHARTPENLARLLPALRELDAHYRGRQGQLLRPDLSHLSSPGHQLLMTRFGPLDLLGTIRGRNRSTVQGMNKDTFFVAFSLLFPLPLLSHEREESFPAFGKQVLFLCLAFLP